MRKNGAPTLSPSSVGAAHLHYSHLHYSLRVRAQ